MISRSRDTLPAAPRHLLGRQGDHAMTSRSRDNRRRAGFCLMISMVILAVAGLLSLQWMRQLRAADAVIDAQARGRQAHWLAQAGESLARARLRQDPNYAGEVWNVPAGSLPDGTALVTLQVERVPERPRLRRVHILARYGSSPPHQVRAERTVVVELNEGEPCT